MPPRAAPKRAVSRKASCPHCEAKGEAIPGLGLTGHSCRQGQTRTGSLRGGGALHLNIPGWADSFGLPCRDHARRAPQGASTGAEQIARHGVGCMTLPAALDIKDRSFETEKRCTKNEYRMDKVRRENGLYIPYSPVARQEEMRASARRGVGRACMHRSLSVSGSRSVGRWLPRPPRSLAGRGSNPLCMSLKDTRRVSSLVVSSMRDVQVVRRSTFESSHSHRPLSSIPRRVHGHMF
jgi:hypothetical protein